MDVFVDYRKWPDTPHWHFAVRELGADEHGRWFVLPGGATVRRGTEPPLVRRDTSVLLVPPDGAWWTAFWHADRTQSFEVYADIVMPPRWSAGRVTLVDLDLDVVRAWDGGVQTLDRDEFEEHRQRLGYPPDVAEAAETAAAELSARLAAGEEPFGDAGRARLARARAELTAEAQKRRSDGERT